MVEAVAEQLRPPAQLADQLLGIGVDQELIGIETVSSIRFVGPMHTITIDRARPRGRQIAVPDFVGIFGKLDAFEFGFTPVIEQT